MDKTILITGSAGFLGQGLAARLAAQGWTVVGFDARQHDLPGPRSTAVVGDLRSAQDLRRAFDTAGAPRVVVHGGGVSGSMVLRDDPAAITGINIGGTVGLLEEMRRRALPHLVFCSSIMAYGPTVDDPVREAEPLRPANVYGATKAAGEALVHSYAAEFGLRAVLLRIAHVYGPGRATACPLRQMIAAALDTGSLDLAVAEATPRQFIHAHDVMDALEAAIAWRGDGSPVINIGPGHQKPLGDVADAVRRTIGPLAVRFAEQSVSPDYRTGALSIDRAQAVLGWTPRVSLEDGLRDFAHALGTHHQPEAGA